MFVNSVNIFNFFFKCSRPSRLVELTFGVIEDHSTQILSSLYEVCFFPIQKLISQYIDESCMHLSVEKLNFVVNAL